MIRKALALSVAVSVLFSLGLGCSYNVNIVSEPEAAKCYVQGMYVGQTPTVYRARSGTPKTVMLKLTKPGYKDVNTVLESNYKADINLLWLIPGLIPYFVGTAMFEDHYRFEMERGGQ